MLRKKSRPPIEKLLRFLKYDPVTGAVTWRVPRGPKKAGSTAGYLDKDGYIRIEHDRISFTAHGFGWAAVTGKWPDKDLDHKDGARTNNRLSNLRLATRAQNNANSDGWKRRKAKYRGVYSTPNPNKPFRAYLANKFLGNFETAEEAAETYNKAAKKMFGEFAKVNVVAKEEAENV